MKTLLYHLFITFSCIFISRIKFNSSDYKTTRNIKNFKNRQFLYFAMAVCYKMANLGFLIIFIDKNKK